jgi:hypothetical protein
VLALRTRASRRSTRPSTAMANRQPDDQPGQPRSVRSMPPPRRRTPTGDLRSPGRELLVHNSPGTWSIGEPSRPTAATQPSATRGYPRRPGSAVPRSLGTTRVVHSSTRSFATGSPAGRPVRVEHQQAPASGASYVAVVVTGPDAIQTAITTTSTSIYNRDKLSARVGRRAPPGQARGASALPPSFPDIDGKLPGHWTWTFARTAVRIYSRTRRANNPLLVELRSTTCWLRQRLRRRPTGEPWTLDAFIRRRAPGLS